MLRLLATFSVSVAWASTDLSSSSGLSTCDEDDTLLQLKEESGQAIPHEDMLADEKSVGETEGNKKNADEKSVGETEGNKKKATDSLLQLEDKDDGWYQPIDLQQSTSHADAEEQLLQEQLLDDEEDLSVAFASTEESAKKKEEQLDTEKRGKKGYRHRNPPRRRAYVPRRRGVVPRRRRRCPHGCNAMGQSRQRRRAPTTRDKIHGVASGIYHSFR